MADRKKQLFAQIMGGEPTLFLTLTTNPARHASPDEAATSLKAAWTKLQRRIKTKYHRKTLPCITVVERTERGYPHLHICLRFPFIPHKLISDFMDREIGAPIVHIERIHNPERAAGYLATYLNQEPAQFGHGKRYWATRDYDLRPKHEKKRDENGQSTWKKHNYSINIWASTKSNSGWTVVWNTPDHCWAIHPP